MKSLKSQVAETVPMVDATPSPTGLSEQWLVRASQVFLAIWFVYYLVQGAKASLWFDGFPVNGPFQLFNPLRRIAAGQVGGRDFVFFHGIGVPYLHYPLFALFGGQTLAASELSRQWTSIVLFGLSLAVFVRATFRNTSRSWIAAAVAVLAMEAVFPGGPAPGHSLVSLRATMPLLAFAALQLQVRDWIKAVLAGCCVALAIVFGTEHGLSLALALLVVVGVMVAQPLLARRVSGGAVLANLKFTVIVTTTSAAFAAFLLLLLCGPGGSVKAIYYNLVDLPGDQFWFFGSPPMPFLGAWRELVLNRHVVLSFLPTYVALAFLGWILFKFWNRPLRLGKDWQALAVLMLVYGILTGVPLLAILSRHYVFPLARILVFTGLVIFANGAAPRILPRWFSLASWSRWPAVAATSFLIVCLAVSIVLAAKSTMLTVALVGHLRSQALYSRTLDNQWNSFMAEATSLIDSHRKRSDLSLWSAYSALLESHYGVFHPADDYIIHSVGPRRWRHYMDTFRATQPEFVTTMTQAFDFEEWLQDVRWEFYEDVLNNYEPLKRVEHAIIWQRKNEPWRPPPADFRTLELYGDSHSVTLPAVSGPDRIGVVRVRYHVRNPWSRLPLLGKTPRYLATIEGTPRNLTISFPPYESQFLFPVQLRAGEPVTMRFNTATLLPGAFFQPDEVQLKVLEWRPSQKAIYGRGY